LRRLTSPLARSSANACRGIAPGSFGASVPDDLDIHVIIDNASTHKTKLIRNWFAKRSRWHVHFTPMSASWINQVERFFGLLTEQ
jgi:transposase